MDDFSIALFALLPSPSLQATMGGGLAKSLRKKDILIIGLDNAGKTTLFKQLEGQLKVNETDIETTPTIGCNNEQVGYKSLKLNVVDMGGRDSVCVENTSFSISSIDCLASIACSALFLLLYSRSCSPSCISTYSEQDRSSHVATQGTTGAHIPHTYILSEI